MEEAMLFKVPRELFDVRHRFIRLAGEPPVHYVGIPWALSLRIRAGRDRGRHARLLREGSGPGTRIAQPLRPWLVLERGRDVRFRTPPAQIRAGAIHALGSHLGCLTANR